MFMTLLAGVTIQFFGNQQPSSSGRG